MKNCPNCHSQTKDEALFCPVCGTMLEVLPQPAPDYFKAEPVQVNIPVIQVKPSFDHTDEFSSEDIRTNRLICMVVYLLDFVGVIIALLMNTGSGYTRFHIRQSLKFTVLEALIAIAALLLCWTVVVPVLCLIAMVILIIGKLSCFVSVCKGQAKDSGIIRIFKFLNDI